MKFDFKKIDMKMLVFGGIILVCILALTFSIYFQIFGENNTTSNETQNNIVMPKETNFNELFDNKLNLQEYEESLNSVNKLEPTNDLVYTTFALNEIYEGKYEINVNIPLININHENAMDIDREIIAKYYQRIANLIDSASR